MDLLCQIKGYDRCKYKHQQINVILSFYSDKMPYLSRSRFLSLSLSFPFDALALARAPHRRTDQSSRAADTEQPSHGGDMALSVPTHRHRGLDGGQVVSDSALHRGPLRTGIRPHRRRGLLLAAGGDRAGQTDQAADLGHRGPGALQVRAAVWKTVMFQ